MSTQTNRKVDSAFDRQSSDVLNLISSYGVSADIAKMNRFNQKTVNEQRARLLRNQRQLWSLCYPEMGSDFNANENVLSAMGAVTFNMTLDEETAWVDAYNSMRDMESSLNVETRAEHAKRLFPNLAHLYLGKYTVRYIVAEIDAWYVKNFELLEDDETIAGLTDKWKQAMHSRESNENDVSIGTGNIFNHIPSSEGQNMTLFKDSDVSIVLLVSLLLSYHYKIQDNFAHNTDDNNKPREDETMQLSILMTQSVPDIFSPNLVDVAVLSGNFYTILSAFALERKIASRRNTGLVYESYLGTTYKSGEEDIEFAKNTEIIIRRCFVSEDTEMAPKTKCDISENPRGLALLLLFNRIAIEFETFYLNTGNEVRFREDGIYQQSIFPQIPGLPALIRILTLNRRSNLIPKVYKELLRDTIFYSNRVQHFNYEAFHMLMSNSTEDDVSSDQWMDASKSLIYFLQSYRKYIIRGSAAEKFAVAMAKWYIDIIVRYPKTERTYIQIPNAVIKICMPPDSIAQFLNGTATIEEYNMVLAYIEKRSTK